jgi:uncharacterized membrane-anchored protein
MVKSPCSNIFYWVIKIISTALTTTMAGGGYQVDAAIIIGILLAALACGLAFQYFLWERTGKSREYHLQMPGFLEI